MLQKHIILGAHITDRCAHAGQVQDVLTRFGETIRTRLGLHEAGETGCSPNGLLVLELVGGDDKAAALAAALSGIEGIEVQTMVFDQP